MATYEGDEQQPLYFHEGVPLVDRKGRYATISLSWVLETQMAPPFFESPPSKKKEWSFGRNKKTKLKSKLLDAMDAKYNAYCTICVNNGIQPEPRMVWKSIA